MVGAYGPEAAGEVLLAPNEEVSVAVRPTSGLGREGTRYFYDITVRRSASPPLHYHKQFPLSMVVRQVQGSLLPALPGESVYLFAMQWQASGSRKYTALSVAPGGKLLVLRTNGLRWVGGWRGGPVPPEIATFVGNHRR